MYKLLFVDDEPKFLRAMKKALTPEEIARLNIDEDALKFVGSPGDALEIAKTLLPDLAVLDILFNPHEGQMGGMPLSRRLRSLRPDMSIIFQTSWDNEAEREDCMNLYKADGYLVKNTRYDPQKLIELIGQVLSKRAPASPPISPLSVPVSPLSSPVSPMIAPFSPLSSPVSPSQLRPDVFISYSRTDRALVDFLVLNLDAALQANNVCTWLDRNMPVGTNWVQNTEEAIKNCAVMVVILSKASVASDYVRIEYSFAQKKHKPIIPIRIDDCEVPMFVQGIQYIDLHQRPLAQALADLLTAIHQYI